MKRIYLAGPISGLNYGECTDWRNDVKNSFNSSQFEVYSPMRGKEFLENTGPIDAVANQGNHPMRTDAAITTRDRNDVKKADVVIMNLLGAKIVSIGTMIEAGWADAFGVPVILVIENQGNLHEHAILKRIAGYRVDNLDDAIKIAKIMLLP